MSANRTWAELISPNTTAITPSRKSVLKECAEDPWAMMSGIDPETQEPLVWTRDESHPDGFRPFPHDKVYLERFFSVLHTRDRVFVEKSRQMIVSTSACLYILWDSLFRNARRWLVSRSIEQDAIELLRDKIRAPWGRLPEWFKQEHPITPSPLRMVKTINSSSYIQAVTENVANRTARGGTATGVLIDEAGYQDQAQEIYAASAPMSQKIFVVTTPNLSLGGEFVKSMVGKAQAGRKVPEFDL